MKLSAAQQEVLDRLKYSSSTVIVVNFSDKDGYFDAAIESRSSRDNLRIATFKSLFRSDLLVECERTTHTDFYSAKFKLAENMHDQDCAEYMRVQGLMIAEFLGKYPNYCRCCHAYGYHGQQDHEGEWEEKECSKCLGKDLCPRCMTPTMVEREDNDMWDTCSTCGWLGGDNDYGMEYCHPNPVECVCS